MKLFGLISGAAAVSEGITQYNDKNGNVVTIDPGCPTLWPKKWVFHPLLHKVFGPCWKYAASSRKVNGLLKYTVFGIRKYAVLKLNAYGPTNGSTARTVYIQGPYTLLFRKNSRPFFSQDSDTVLPYWKKECPPIDLCYPNIRQKQAIKPYSKNCKVDGANAPDASCCTNGRFLIDFS